MEHLQITNYARNDPDDRVNIIDLADFIAVYFTFV